MVRSGKVRYIGCPNFSGRELMKRLAVLEKYGLSGLIIRRA
jgi:aryl-alcohol dehydrogenase-like predicted oxidoreductase